MSTHAHPAGSRLGLNHSVRGAALALVMPAALAAATAAPPARSLASLHRGDPAPPIVLNTIAGEPVNTADMRGHCLLLVFGEAGHEKTRLACDIIGKTRSDPELAGQSITWVLILSKSSDPDELHLNLPSEASAPIIVHDVARRAFGDYRVIAMPSVVIVDREGRMVHAMAGLSDRLGDIVRDALLLAVGKSTVEQFEETLHPTQAPPPDKDHVRAQRLARLARKLLHRGLDEMAQAKLREALALDAECVPARLGLGELHLKRQQPVEAEAQFRAVLKTTPESLDAALGLAFAYTMRGGDAMAEGEKLAREVVQRSPSRARAHYLIGLIHEKRREVEKAAASFKKAAELLLDRAAED